MDAIRCAYNFSIFSNSTVHNQQKTIEKAIMIKTKTLYFVYKWPLNANQFFHLVLTWRGLSWFCHYDKQDLSAAAPSEYNFLVCFLLHSPQQLLLTLPVKSPTPFLSLRCKLMNFLLLAQKYWKGLEENPQQAPLFSPPPPSSVHIFSPFPTWSSGQSRIVSWDHLLYCAPDPFHFLLPRGITQANGPLLLHHQYLRLSRLIPVITLTYYSTSYL